MNNLKILLVDCNKNLLEILQATLARDGYRVSVAHDLNAALAAALHTQPDVIITDYNIPGGTGMLLSEKLHAAGFSDFRLVLLFEYAADFSAPLWDAVATGRVTGFLLKPFTKVELRAVLNYATTLVTQKPERPVQPITRPNPYLQPLPSTSPVLSY